MRTANVMTRRFASDSGGEVAMSTTPPHSHTANEECVYVLEGVLRHSVDQVTCDLGPGEWMRTPPGSVHQFGNPHAAPASRPAESTSGR